MIVMIDHEDSFTYNLVHYLETTHEKVKIFHHEEINWTEIKELAPKAIILSPGPGHPKDQAKSIELVKNLYQDIPILGVCLGFQIIVHAFGGKIIEAERPMHGRIDFIKHDGESVYQGLENPIQVTRYHSLIADQQVFPQNLKVSGVTKKGEIMSCRHINYPLEGVQFHPEAILTTEGKKLLQNFINSYANNLR